MGSADSNGPTEAFEGIDDALRLSIVKRWGIIDMMKTQSVAEHSYNVAVIATALADSRGWDDHKIAMLGMVAIIHDINEVFTGDLPTTLKRGVLGDFIRIYERNNLPGPDLEEVLETEEYHILKIADCVDALYIVQRYCIDVKKEYVWDYVFTDLLTHCEACEMNVLHMKQLFAKLSLVWGYKNG